eukprot:TRINITY_DN10961_c0_g1_i1.p1 TRINITY_DN10961_c0_g1~~TRINITY_DN10961_c0_g1_i1.p1  ORF type:complete len:684 (-),score=51.16 TRINITY_DN10961_c0_g1_i1:73-2124(-)
MAAGQSLLLGLTAGTVLFVLFVGVTLTGSPSSATVRVDTTESGGCAYVTIVHHAAQWRPALVLLRSLLLTKPRYPVRLLVAGDRVANRKGHRRIPGSLPERYLPSFVQLRSDGVQVSLIAANSIPISSCSGPDPGFALPLHCFVGNDTGPIPTPPAVLAELWRLTDLRRALFIHPSLLVVRNIDAVFETSVQTTAAIVKTPRRRDQPRVVLVSPSEAALSTQSGTARRHPGANFGLPLAGTEVAEALRTASTLAPHFEVPASVAPYARSLANTSRVSIVSFASPAPWAIGYANPLQNWDFTVPGAAWYWIWQRVERTMEEVALITATSASPTTPREYQIWRTNIVPPQQIQGSSAKNMLPWPNIDRVPTVCDAFVGDFGRDPRTFNSFPIADKFSVEIAIFAPQRWPLVAELVRRWRKSQMIHTFFIRWHTPASAPPLRQIINLQNRWNLSFPVKFLWSHYNTLQSRFEPIADLRTQALLILDDDMEIDLADAEWAFSVWKRNPSALMGMHVRNVVVQGASNGIPAYRYGFERDACHPSKQPLNVVLTKIIWLPSPLLFWYTCLAPEVFHRYTDECRNGDDIFLNCVAAASGLPVTHVTPEVLELDRGVSGALGGISEGAKRRRHIADRQRALSLCAAVIGREPFQGRAWLRVDHPKSYCLHSTKRNRSTDDSDSRRMPEDTT